MASVKIEISLDNDSVQDNNFDEEIMKILGSMRAGILLGLIDGHLMDSNGNTVGTWKVEE